MRIVACSLIASFLLGAAMSPRDFAEGPSLAPAGQGATVAPIFVDFGFALDLRRYLTP